MGMFRLRLPLRSGGAARHRDTAAGSSPPSFELVCDILDEFGLTHVTDSDGDLLVRWENCTVFFFFYGERQEVLQARLYLDRRFSVDARGSLALLLDEWNRTKLYPKAYTVLPDNGIVGVCAEHCFDFEKGATRQQVTYTLGVWLETLLRFASWVDTQVPVG
ncbi:MAG: YbjN domain-containing protein [Jatrophihabitans sp.]|nr:MAG: YbjN domain-containing protein [Jatrophihabitans sp.]